MSTLLLQLAIFLLFLKLLSDVLLLRNSAFAGDPAGFIAVAVDVFSFSWRACCGWPLPASPLQLLAFGGAPTVARL
jgi:hypothetical protein